MKKTFAILLVFALTFAAAFAVETATLNLSTTVGGVTRAAIIKGDAVPNAFPTSGIIGDTKQDVTLTKVSYVFVVETNQNLGSVGIQAGILKSGNHHLFYEVVADGHSSIAAKDAGAILLLMVASPNTAGKRVIGGVFTVQGVATTGSADVANSVFGLDNAPAGAYEGSVMICFEAS